LAKENVDIALFCDHFLSSVFATHEFNQEHSNSANWDVIVLIQEFGTFAKSYALEKCVNIDHILGHDEHIWGPSYFFDEPVTSKNELTVQSNVAAKECEDTYFMRIAL
jgi:hypothetical protein